MPDLMTAIQAMPGIGPFLPYLTVLIAMCAALSTFLPPPKEGAPSWYRGLYGAINFVALNLGHARNATAPGAAPIATPNNGQSV